MIICFVVQCPPMMITKNRLSKILAAAGVASRRRAEELIFDGKVSVNGSIVRAPQTMVSPSTDVIYCAGERIKALEDKQYFILNKPTGYICTNLRPGNKKIVIDLFAGESQRLFTVGRLDRETSGLLIVTNDGHFANQVIHPSSNIEKEYLVKTVEDISHDHLVAISNGGPVEGVWVKPVRVTKVRRGSVKIVVKEGKKREIRTLVEQAGLQLISLERVRIGSLRLGPLPVGHYKVMTEQEKKALFN